MRAGVDGLASPYSFGELLPAVFHEDPLAQRFMTAFDEVLAPIVSVIDNGDHYLDAHLSPFDFLAYLAGWVGIELDETWTEAALRDLVAHAAELFKVRGTPDGLRRYVTIYTGVEPEIDESGGCTFSAEPNGALPGDDDAHLVVRVTLPEDSPVDQLRLDQLVASAKPAHIPHRVEVLRQ